MSAVPLLVLMVLRLSCLTRWVPLKLCQRLDGSLSYFVDRSMLCCQLIYDSCCQARVQRQEATLVSCSLSQAWAAEL